MYKVVLDTNILVSALNFGGKPELVLRSSHGRSKRFDLYLSLFILQELSVTLSNKFIWSQPRIDRAVWRLVKWAEVVQTKKSLSVISADESDNRILECAVKAKADFIVSGDSHLLALREYKGISIVKPAQFLRILEREK